MLPAPDALYDVPLYVERAKVHPDHHIEVARALYSVPTLYLRNHVRVRADRTLVKIYFGTELFKMHERQPPGGRATAPADYPTGKSVYATRDVTALLDKAKERGLHIGIYAERRLAGLCPGTRCGRRLRSSRFVTSTATVASRRSVRARLRSTSSASRASPTCSSRRRGHRAPEAAEKVVQLPLPRFVRATEEFETRSSATTKKVT